MGPPRDIQELKSRIICELESNPPPKRKKRLETLLSQFSELSFAHLLKLYGDRHDKDEYNRQYYQRNKERLKQRARERKQGEPVKVDVGCNSAPAEVSRFNIF